MENHLNLKATKSVRNILFAGLIGLVLEFYDFTIYAVFAEKLGALFFPNTSHMAQILSSLAVFAAGFFMRPIGGLLFGHIGDVYGRRIALIIAATGMALITASIGFLPTYYEIGILAPVLLVTFRLIQGVCVGGEGAGASIFVLEHLHHLKPGLIGGIANASLTLGILLAIFVGMMLNYVFGVASDAWRYAFMLGGVLGVIGLIFRLKVSETPVFDQIQQENKLAKLPIKNVVQQNWKSVILTIAVGGLTSASAYLVMTYLSVYLKTFKYMDPNTALLFSLFGNFLLIILLPVMGMISDKFGYDRFIAIGCCVICVAAVPIFMLISSDDVIQLIMGIVLLSTLIAWIYAPLYPFMLKLFSPEQRYSGIACFLNVGIAIFGGTCSMICIYLVQTTQIHYIPAVYWMFVAFIFLMTLKFIKRKNIFSYLFNKDIRDEAAAVAVQK
jgi:MHS family proline/betaine transporter-like MFS transporter